MSYISKIRSIKQQSHINYLPYVGQLICIFIVYLSYVGYMRIAISIN